MELCTKCGDEPRAKGQRWGKRCRAAWMRAHRPKHTDLPDEQRRRANARAYANVYLRRGKIERGPCEDCGGPGEEMHHDDYSKPLAITWLCTTCHGVRTVGATA